MITFLASSPTKALDEECPVPALNEKNGFVAQLQQIWRENARCLMVVADPDAHSLNDEMTDFYREAVIGSGLSVGCFDLWDSRYLEFSAEQLGQYDVIFLSGGHVPTERAWFEWIHLKEKLEAFHGILIGTSAGSMNAARVVYAWPEMEGESEDPDYELFFPGLGLAESMILPHYQQVKDSYLDGKRLIEDIACSHSYGKRFWAIPDGSYILVQDGVETIFGEAYLISDGKIEQFCEEGDIRTL